MANYQAARALLGKAKSGGGARKPAVKNGATGVSDIDGEPARERVSCW